MLGARLAYNMPTELLVLNKYTGTWDPQPSALELVLKGCTLTAHRLNSPTWLAHTQLPEKKSPLNKPVSHYKDDGNPYFLKLRYKAFEIQQKAVLQ